ncbi:uroporphyrinogen-III synthase [Altererythrobacter sp. CC-YST694]|uniref:uroporphyrinogen-III synthase n=1 Tax=Altererythrobacter sp. CC-YST694 TaxID=2755038 RepID=UPI001D02B761|nr:uroporphyrinogen-III synthase [Altererythrobacter sp. CC-YST694]
MKRAIVIRPRRGMEETLAAGRAAGLDIVGWPLFEMRPLAWDVPVPEGIDGLLVGSANAFRLGGPGLAAFTDKPVHAVGKATADAARAAGFRAASVGAGGLQQVLNGLAGQPLTLLRLAGEKHVPLNPPLGIVLVTRVIYQSVALPMPEDMAQALQEGDPVVLLYSADAAGHLACECHRLGIGKERIALAALGPRIAAAAGPGWAQLRSASAPNEAALLALAQDMCH